MHPRKVAARVRPPGSIRVPDILLALEARAVEAHRRKKRRILLAGGALLLVFSFSMLLLFLYGVMNADDVPSRNEDSDGADELSHSQDSVPAEPAFVSEPEDAAVEMLKDFGSLWLLIVVGTGVAAAGISILSKSR